jgi:nucleotidyltransferase substrate binding protein (TIGR01987 family)
MDTAELRWRQRLESLGRALGQLEAALAALDADPASEVIGEAFAAGLLPDGQVWIDMLEQRNLMAHTYDVKRAQRALALIRGTFAPALRSLAQNLEQRP